MLLGNGCGQRSHTHAPENPRATQLPATPLPLSAWPQGPAPWGTGAAGRPAGCGCSDPAWAAHGADALHAGALATAQLCSPSRMALHRSQRPWSEGDEVPAAASSCLVPIQGIAWRLLAAHLHPPDCCISPGSGLSVSLNASASGSQEKVLGVERDRLHLTFCSEATGSFARLSAGRPIFGTPTCQLEKCLVQLPTLEEASRRTQQRDWLLDAT